MTFPDPISLCRSDITIGIDKAATVYIDCRNQPYAQQVPLHSYSQFG